ncbi:MAG: histone deacetylase [Thermodesulfobacteriota bacterium]
MPTLLPLTVITDPLCHRHDTGGNDHPETPARLTAIADRLGQSPLAPQLVAAASRVAERQWLTTVHSEEYLYRFEETTLAGKSHLDHPDNQLCFESYDAALASAGAGLVAIDLLESGTTTRAFCCGRPPGHHAERSLALGFCFLNNAAIAARYWQQAHGRRRVMIIDWDAHHGNGVQAAFEEDPEVFYLSIHEHPTWSFPGTGWKEETGLGPGKGATCNIPLPPGSDDATVMQAIAGQVEPALDRFAPEALIICAGFDGHAADDMSGLSYSTGLYRRLGDCASRWAAQYCNGKVLSLLEGGYHLESLAAGVEAYLTGLMTSET